MAMGWKDYDAFVEQWVYERAMLCEATRKLKKENRLKTFFRGVRDMFRRK